MWCECLRVIVTSIPIFSFSTLSVGFRAVFFLVFVDNDYFPLSLVLGIISTFQFGFCFFVGISVVKKQRKSAHLFSFVRCFIFIFI